MIMRQYFWSVTMIKSPTSLQQLAVILSIPSLRNTYFVLRRKVSCILQFPNQCGILYRCKLVQYLLGKFHRNHRLSHSRNCTYHHCHNHQMMHSFVPLNRLYEFYAKKYFYKLLKSSSQQFNAKTWSSGALGRLVSDPYHSWWNYWWEVRTMLFWPFLLWSIL